MGCGTYMEKPFVHIHVNHRIIKNGGGDLLATLGYIHMYIYIYMYCMYTTLARTFMEEGIQGFNTRKST